MFIMILELDFIKKENNLKKSKAIIIDIDGTLANVDHRLHLLPDNMKKFLSNEEISKDSLNEWCSEILWSIKLTRIEIIFCSGRMESARETTCEWFERNDIMYPHNMFMRGLSDYRADHIVKRELYERYIEPFYEIIFVIDDRSSVVNMWRDLGLTCLQCAKGNF